MTELRVLIVEPEEPSRAFLQELMRGRGHHGLSVGSLAEALDALQEGPFDLVVMELELPADPDRLPLFEHGYALETAVQDNTRRGQTPPYLLVRGRAGITATEVSLAHDHGCDAFVPKSDRERLLAKLGEAEARAASRTTGRTRSARLPLKVKTWDDCTLVLGQPTRARMRAGAEVVVEPSPSVEKVLYQLLFGDPGSDLADLAEPRTTRRSLARDARRFLRSVFKVSSGPSDPLPWNRTLKVWESRVRLREGGLDQVRGAYADLRRRADTGLGEDDA